MHLLALRVVPSSDLNFLKWEIVDTVWRMASRVAGAMQFHSRASADTSPDQTGLVQTDRNSGSTQRLHIYIQGHAGLLRGSVEVFCCLRPASLEQANNCKTKRNSVLFGKIK